MRRLLKPGGIFVPESELVNSPVHSTQNVPQSGLLRIRKKSVADDRKALAKRLEVTLPKCHTSRIRNSLPQHLQKACTGRYYLRVPIARFVISATKHEQPHLDNQGFENQNLMNTKTA
jgi:hypothetical protein